MSSSPSTSAPSPDPRRPSAPDRRAFVVIGAAGVLLALVLLVWTSLGDDHSDTPTTTQGAGEPVDVGHIHGIGVDPGDGRVYIGAHQGVFVVGPDGEVQPVGSERFDTMGFTVAGPGRFLASGHPQLGSDRPPHLGLFESGDTAQTWSSTSLAGEADFHALEATGTRVWGADSVGGRLLTSLDGREWELLAEGRFIDIAADPGHADRVLATDEAGQLVAYEAAGGDSGSVGLDAPAMTYLDWPTSDELAGLGPDGTTLVSRDEGATWEERGTVPGSPSAFEADAGAWYAASDAGLFTSTDDGASWTPLFTYRADR